ncbi:ABC transporter ATP-binding protein [Amnibacterium sp. CER49]|uniref:ABC transporter ATP-binding protein n=1 Tax=Amnibacterium sp. CER49 TaxID=3039161 RepID=UPI00244D553B|nr:ABC transporter ATP-binding protein [Amnibacterium sp. CER49]MDH2444067.1 ABC transporter ATP-binding protein [Amnibacterium sp. CER49]
MSVLVDVEQAVCIHRTADSEVVALRGADLLVEEGELVALVGPSGSGKSTLMALLAGLLRPSAGQVRVLGRDVARATEREALLHRSQDIGMLMQGPERNLLPYATVRANVELAQLAARAPRRERHRRAAELLEAVGMGSASSRRAGTLSGGEQQRVALAAALATGPRLLLADEPTSQLDRENAAGIARLLRTARDRWGTTVLVVTHDAELGDAMDRRLTMRDGRIGTEARSGEQYAVIGRDGTVQLPADVADRFPAGGRARVVRRPGHIELHPLTDEPGKRS